MILAAAGILALAAPQVSYAQDEESAAAEEQVEATVDEAIAADDVVADNEKVKALLEKNLKGEI